MAANTLHVLLVNVQLKNINHLCSFPLMLPVTHYAQNYASIIGWYIDILLYCTLRCVI